MEKKENKEETMNEKWFKLGKKSEKEKIVRQIIEFLDIDNLIYQAMQDHEVNYHK
jgi:chaperone required for assembly of F1-ATPase